MADADATGTSIATGQPDTSATQSDTQTNQESIASGGASPKDWAQTFEEPVRKVVDRYSGPEALASAYVDLEKKIGERFQAPGEGSTQKELDDWYTALGRPESQGGYELDKIINSEGNSGEELFRAAAHGANLSQTQANAMWRLANQSGADQVRIMHQQQEAQHAEGWNSLRREWGENTDANVTRAQQLARTFGDEDFVRVLNKGPGNEPSVIKFLNNVAKELSEDTLETGKPALRKVASRLYPNSPEMYEGRAG
jgi:hypothetical protein